MEGNLPPPYFSVIFFGSDPMRVYLYYEMMCNDYTVTIEERVKSARTNSKQVKETGFVTPGPPGS